MNCFMCKGNLENKKVNYVVDLEDAIIIIKEVVNQLKQVTKKVTIVKYKDKVA